MHSSVVNCWVVGRRRYCCRLNGRSLLLDGAGNPCAVYALFGSFFFSFWFSPSCLCPHYKRDSLPDQQWVAEGDKVVFDVFAVGVAFVVAVAGEKCLLLHSASSSSAHRMCMYSVSSRCGSTRSNAATTTHLGTHMRCGVNAPSTPGRAGVARSSVRRRASSLPT